MVIMMMVVVAVMMVVIVMARWGGCVLAKAAWTRVVVTEMERTMYLPELHGH